MHTALVPLEYRTGIIHNGARFILQSPVTTSYTAPASSG